MIKESAWRKLRRFNTQYFTLDRGGYLDAAERTLGYPTGKNAFQEVFKLAKKLYRADNQISSTSGYGSFDFRHRLRMLYYSILKNHSYNEQTDLDAARTALNGLIKESYNSQNKTK